ncbi:MAG: Aspartyl-tRNA(Asn)/glutamyl-tRNA(Gln) amidotransferase subunit, partial [Rhizorhabdus sp.]|nr:Aspartyl-tRNA(Asn)/glutamyl-tRNA(Gln) amidotransferase subunit [Rhizorhabdus sp.]
MVVDRPADQLGAATIGRAVREGRLSAVAVIESRLTRIERLNPRLNCFTEVMADRARREALAIDTMVTAGRDPGPLAGVPFGVKDNYDVAGRVTTAGSIINCDHSAAIADAVLLQRLSAAGAVLVGTQNMDEYAYGFTTENAHYGATHNPHDLQRSAGGSSGGSAAAVAAGLCDFSLGTDTNGSIRVPSSFCGIFGLKPTFGRLPRTGTFPFVHELDHLGPFARSVADLALIYDLIQGHDPGDAACIERPADPPVRDRLDDLRYGTRVAVLDGWFSDLADAQGLAA